MQGIITYTVAETFSDDEETVNAFRSCIRPNTRAIIVTHGSNVFGVKLPIARLAQLARQYGLYFAVDAAQTAGIEPIDVKGMQIDFLCTAGHKGLYGPTGSGLLITSCGKRLRPLAEGGTAASPTITCSPISCPTASRRHPQHGGHPRHGRGDRLYPPERNGADRRV